MSEIAAEDFSPAATRQDCSHCHLPVTPQSLRRMLNGREQAFCCYGCCLAFQVGGGDEAESAAAYLLIRLGVGAFFAMNIMLFSLLLYSGAAAEWDAQLVQIVDAVLWVLATPVLIILGGPFIIEAARGLRHGRLNADSLISVAALAAYGYSAIAVLDQRSGVYFDTATMLLVLFTLGRYLEASGRAKAVRSIEPFFQAEEGWAEVVGATADERRRVRDVRPGVRLRIRPGERICVDGEVAEGRSEVDEAVITGESAWRVKGPGDRVRAGGVNQTGQLIIICRAPASESHWAAVCRAARRALAAQTPIQQLSDKVAAVFVPLVFALAGATALYWLGKADVETALLAGLAVLVVACPCALGLAAPLATTMGIGLLSRRGIQIRSGAVFESLAGVRGAAFDKTGTLTAGGARLSGLIGDGCGDEALLAAAAALERGSSHPFAQAVCRAAEKRRIKAATARDIQTRPGFGLVGVVNDQPIAVGTMALMTEMGWVASEALKSQALRREAAGQNIVWVGWGGRARGLLLLEDRLDPQAQGVIAALRRRGLFTALLTGDRQAAAARIAQAAGIDELAAELSPRDKVAVLAGLARRRGPMAMVGDGVNDGPVLAAAAVGVAVGGATDLARATADIALPENGLGDLPWIFQVGAGVRRTIRLNLAYAFGYNAAALALAAAGQLPPVLAALLMVGSSIMVVLNTARLRSLADD